MTHLRIDGLTKHFAGKPPTTAIDGLDFEIEQGEFLVLLGPSGCGKTTTLRCLAGLETPTRAGSPSATAPCSTPRAHGPAPGQAQHRDGVPVLRAVAAHDRAQEHRVPLKARKMKGPARRWVEEHARSSTVAARPLSGPAQWRSAAARRPGPGLVARPDLVLFDEPLSNLDARLRDHVRAQMHELHARLKFTAVFVTHDQCEALALADRVAICGRAASSRSIRRTRLRAAGHRIRRRLHRHVQPVASRAARRRLDVRRARPWPAIPLPDRRVDRRAGPARRPAAVAGRLDCPPEQMCIAAASSTRSSAAATWTSSWRSGRAARRPRARAAPSEGGPAARDGPARRRRFRPATPCTTAPRRPARRARFRPRRPSRRGSDAWPPSIGPARPASLPARYRLLAPPAVIVLLLVIAYLVLMPLYRLQPSRLR